ncbi:MAG: TrkH family potassium uptake protein [Spirochaetia bacterium]|nr:TrkH family potassium uptake protein [Spirochaetia bacterium]
MNYRVLASITGLLLLLVSFFLVFFVLIAYFIYPQEAQYTAFLFSFLITIFVGFVLWMTGKNIDSNSVSFREGFAVAGIGWIVVALFGALPAYISGDIPLFTDSYFESMSGFTTTGASILENIENKGHTVLLWRSFTHWLGGMGFIVLSLAFLPALGIGGMQLYKAEVPGPAPDKLMPRVGETARILYLVYTFITFAQFLLLYGGGMNIFESLCHTFGTMGTGGFSPLNSSVGQYAASFTDNALFFEIIIIVFMFIAGTNFSLHYKALKGDFTVYLKDPEFRFYLILVLGGILTVTVNLYTHSNYESILEAFRHSSFTVVSIITTTGYGTEDFDKWPAYSKFLLMFFMFIGGMAGSTGGGMKILRIMAVIKESFAEIQRTIHPKKVYSVRFGATYISRDILQSLNSFVILYILLYIIGILILSITDYSFETISSMVIACLSNIGPGFADVGPTKNYSHLPAYAKWVLSYFMVLGRLELIPVVALILPRIWKK